MVLDDQFFNNHISKALVNDDHSRHTFKCSSDQGTPALDDLLARARDHAVWLLGFIGFNKSR